MLNDHYLLVVVIIILIKINILENDAVNKWVDITCDAPVDQQPFAVRQ